MRCNMDTHYVANQSRYSEMQYRRCGQSGILLPIVSLGFWHNFGSGMPVDNSRAMMRTAFDLGITHFDLANNYGPPEGAAELNFGRILKEDLYLYRDELIISTKAGYYMWPGPYGDNGSRKYLLASLDQSLKRMKLDYVDIFYSHRRDPNTPLEETMGALATAVQQGKALYVGISSYNAEDTRKATAILKDMGVRCLIHQPSYNMFNRWPEEQGLIPTLGEIGVGMIAFCPLAQGLLTNRYLNGIPSDSRIAKGELNKEHCSEDKLAKVRELGKIAEARGVSMAQLALLWVLRDERVTSALIGASSPKQIIENATIAKLPALTAAEVLEIERILA